MQKMNEKARLLGMADTHFTDCTGLFDDPNHYSCAYDVAVMARELISQDYVGEFFDVPYLLDLLDQHYSGKVKTHRKLYTVLSFLIWYRVYFPEKCGAEPFRP